VAAAHFYPPESERPKPVLGITHVVDSPREHIRRPNAEANPAFDREEWMERQRQARLNRERIESDISGANQPRISISEVPEDSTQSEAERVKQAKIAAREAEEQQHKKMLEEARKQAYQERKDLQAKIQQQLSSGT
jgi:hypothetical protein